MSSKKNVVGYDRWSSFYDSYSNPTVAIDGLCFPGFYHSVQDQKVLELGCGTGRHTAGLVKAGNQVDAMDASEGMLRVAKEKVKDPKVSFYHSDFMSSSLHSTGYDTILMSLVLEHIASLDAFFELCVGVLKPLGQIFLSEIHPSRATQGKTAHFKDDSGEFFSREYYSLS